MSHELNEPVGDDIDLLDLLIPAPRRSPENGWPPGGRWGTGGAVGGVGNGAG